MGLFLPGPLVTVILRLSFGLMVATGLAFVGFFAGWFAAPPGPVLPASILMTGSGLGAAVGGLMGWYKPESPRSVKWITVVLVLTGGLAGAWLGWELGSVFYPEGVDRPGGTIYNAPPFFVALIGAGIGANVFAMMFYSFRLWRYREI
jgi:hypothetical protein